MFQLVMRVTPAPRGVLSSCRGSAIAIFLGVSSGASVSIFAPPGGGADKEGCCSTSASSSSAFLPFPLLDSPFLGLLLVFVPFTPLAATALSLASSWSTLMGVRAVPFALVRLRGDGVAVLVLAVAAAWVGVVLPADLRPLLRGDAGAEDEAGAAPAGPLADVDTACFLFRAMIGTLSDFEAPTSPKALLIR